MTAPLSNWSTLKAKRYFLAVWLPLVLLLHTVQAQQHVTGNLTYSHSVAISSPAAISQDRDGSVYLLDAKRTLYKFDTAGKPVLNFSPPTRGRITAVDAWNPMKVLLFYEDRQELLLLDRFLRPITSTQLSDFTMAGVVRAATLASDDGFWLFDGTELTLRKLDMRNRTSVVETPLNLVLDNERFDVRLLREYQNMVYMLDANGGIFVFDNLGNYKKNLPHVGLSYLSFSGNELYFIKENKLHFQDLYSLQTRTLDLPAGKSYQSALVHANYLYLFTKNELEVYTVQP